MRHVMTNRELGHVWYYRQQSDARTSDGHYYFRCDTIYSYGSHFPIARHVVNSAGNPAVLFTTRDYSVTTQRHKSLTARAIPHDAVVFHVPLTGSYAPSSADLAEYLRSYESRIMTAGTSLTRVRSQRRKEYGFAALVALILEANQFIGFYRLKHAAFEVPADLESLRDTLKRVVEAKRVAEVKEQARLKRKNSKLIKQWIAGDSVEFPASIKHVYLRIHTARYSDDIVVQTSMGVEFPISHAVLGLRAIKQVVASGVEYRSNGHTIHLGVYALERIELNGNVTAGCHYVTFDEIQRIAPQLEAMEVK